MIEKQFKNLDEQIEIFKHKGMIINDERYAKTVLLRENYFFLNQEQHLKKCIVYFCLIDHLEILYLNIYLL